mmetsp:Transcript_19618/g.36092  ORF Transcript_19618/g.36092 Transcript_19618/m.36092 type:complete len:367 (+) Transcript_19618:5101-6201(+)
MVLIHRITEEGYKSLLTHKYQTTGYSWFDTNVMNYFWEAFAKILPRWMAPNLVTLIGLVFMIAHYLVMLFYDTTFSLPIPPNVIYFSTFGVFMYQTLDAVDGKHARAIGAASPLGMLMDHGCDALSSIFITLGLAQAAGLGLGSHLLLIYLGVQLMFFMATWEEYHTHVCRTQILNWGVTELQFLNMSIVLSTGLFGPGWLRNQVLPGIDIVDVLVYSNVFMAGVMGIIMSYSVIATVKSPLHAVLRLLPIGMLQGLLLLFPIYTKVYYTHAPLLFITEGLLFATLACKLIIFSVTSHPFPILHVEPFIFASFFALREVTKCEACALQTVAIAAFLVFASFVVSITRQIAKRLRINVLTVTPKEKD